MIFLSTKGPTLSLACVPRTILAAVPTLALALTLTAVPTAAPVLSLAWTLDTLLIIEAVVASKLLNTSFGDDLINVITGATATDSTEATCSLSPSPGAIVEDDFIPEEEEEEEEEKEEDEEEGKEEAVVTAVTTAPVAMCLLTGISILLEKRVLSFRIEEDLGLSCDCFIKSAKLISPWAIS